MKVYSGPGGIFYDARHDCIFALVSTDEYIGKTRRFKRASGLYDVYYRHNRALSRNVGLIAWPKGEVVRLGPLPVGWPRK